MRLSFRQWLLREDFVKGPGVGTTVFVYHRTPVPPTNIDKFKIGSRAMYGPGIYATYSIDPHINNEQNYLYGDYIVKVAVDIKGFLIFDPGEAYQIHKTHTLREQMEKLGIDVPVPEFSKNQIDKTLQAYRDEGSIHSADIALNFYKAYPAITTKVDGIMYTGDTDGPSLVCYKPEMMHPVAYVRIPREEGMRLGWKDLANLKWEPIGKVPE